MAETVPTGGATPAAFLPASLAEAGISLRPQTETDLEFVRDLYVSHRWEELQAVPNWTDEQRLAFLRDQARLQWWHYAENYYDAQFLIVEKNGERIGRLYLFHHNRKDLRIVEIGLLPAWRGRGFGTALLTRVQEYARSVGKTCSIHVEANNPARRLYRRLGFAETKTEGPYFLMEWRAQTVQLKTA
jgi:ribosomal protein S18 acetylase RimI-like enzyme